VKDTLWEGGVRGAAFLWSALIPPRRRGRVANQMMNVQDWLPTLFAAAGGDAGSLPANIDGIDMVWHYRYLV